MMRAVCQISGAYNLASVIDPACGAVIPTKGPNVGKDSPLPDESMVGEIARSSAPGFFARRSPLRLAMNDYSEPAILIVFHAAPIRQCRS